MRKDIIIPAGSCCRDRQPIRCSEQPGVGFWGCGVRRVVCCNEKLSLSSTISCLMNGSCCTTLWREVISLAVTVTDRRWWEEAGFSPVDVVTARLKLGASPHHRPFHHVGPILRPDNGTRWCRAVTSWCAHHTARTYAGAVSVARGVNWWSLGVCLNFFKFKNLY